MAKSELLHRRPQHRLEDVGLAHEAEVVGVGGVGGAFGVVAVEMVAGDVTEFGDAFFLELVVGSAEGGVVVVVEFLLPGVIQSLVKRRSSTRTMGVLGRAARSCFTSGTHLAVTSAGPMLGRQSIT